MTWYESDHLLQLLRTVDRRKAAHNPLLRYTYSFLLVEVRQLYRRSTGWTLHLSLVMFSYAHSQPIYISFSYQHIVCNPISLMSFSVHHSSTPNPRSPTPSRSPQSFPPLLHLYEILQLPVCPSYPHFKRLRYPRQCHHTYLISHIQPYNQYALM